MSSVNTGRADEGDAPWGRGAFSSFAGFGSSVSLLPAASSFGGLVGAFGSGSGFADSGLTATIAGAGTRASRGSVGGVANIQAADSTATMLTRAVSTTTRTRV